MQQAPVSASTLIFCSSDDLNYHSGNLGLHGKDTTLDETKHENPQ